MTDNEKAATFIGWKPEQICRLEYSYAARLAYEKAASTSSCACGAPYSREHPIPAPDMSDPRNYMKALEGLPPRYQWIIERDECQIENEVLECHGATVREALAALYDAEHPNS